VTYYAGDDATWTVPVIDSNGGPLNDAAVVTARRWLGDTVTIDDADWTGAATPVEDQDGATSRVLAVPLVSLPVGLWSLRLVIAGDADLFLGNVHIE
jgi:hypothetical protein